MAFSSDTGEELISRLQVTPSELGTSSWPSRPDAGARETEIWVKLWALLAPHSPFFESLGFTVRSESRALVS